MKKKHLSFMCLFLAVALCVSGCGGSNYAKATAAREDTAYSTAAYAPAEAGAYYDEEAYAEEPYGGYAMDNGYMSEAADDAEYKTDSGGQAAGNVSQGDPDEPEPQEGGALDASKLVYTCDMRIETTEYSATVAAIHDKITALGGIIESENESDEDHYWYYEGHRKTSGTKHLVLTVRVPAKNYTQFVEDTAGIAKVRNRSQNVQNISRSYHSVEAQIAALTKEEERLKEMMDKAETIEEMIIVEDRLTEVEAALNSYRTKLSSMDLDVAYSTVTLYVDEVLVYSTEPAPTITFAQRLQRTFGESWESFRDFLEGALFVLIRLLPFLILIGIIVIPVRVILKKTAPKRAERKESRRQKKLEENRRRIDRKYGSRGGNMGGYSYGPMGGTGNPPLTPGAAPSAPDSVTREAEASAPARETAASAPDAELSGTDAGKETAPENAEDVKK